MTGVEVSTYCRAEWIGTDLILFGRGDHAVLEELEHRVKDAPVAVGLERFRTKLSLDEAAHH